jgi:methyltransferase (TIGR00027 family)
MNPISQTAFYCCGIRMQDAQSGHPICDDRYAARFMDERGLEIFQRFGGETRPNASNVARARYIDDLLRGFLAQDPHLQIVLIGCGFDSRAFRLTGGSWYEFDEPQLIAYKNERLPESQAPNPLLRVGIDFAAEPLAKKLEAVPRTVHTVFVIEGVTMYVTAESLRVTLLSLQARFPVHRVVVDLMTRTFLNRYGATIKRIISQLGAEMIPGDAPALPFTESAYRELSSVSVAGLAFRYRALPSALGVVMRVIAPGLFSGYTVRVFHSSAAQDS